jgi:hypothetical protein
MQVVKGTRKEDRVWGVLENLVEKGKLYYGSTLSFSVTKYA